MRDAARLFLERSGWAGDQAIPIAGDLSARRYYRLIKGSETAVLMDDEAGVDTSVPAFVTMTRWLRDLSLSAPNILAKDADNGLLLLEDLGNSPVSAMLSDKAQRESALKPAIGLLLTIRKASPAALPQPTVAELCQWTCLADEFYPGADTGLLEQFRSVLEPVLLRLWASTASVSLRDFHADNLMWLPERLGVARLGLLDYQDAMLAHPVYDLVSLLTDARSEISRDTRREYFALYAHASGDDIEMLGEAFAAYSLQRNLRILGIFHRAAKVDGKTHHLPKVPRVYRYLKEALEHSSFASLRPHLAKALPEPTGLP